MKKVLLLAGVSALAVTSASAALVVPALDTTDFEAVALAVLTATAVFFGIRKALQLLG